MQASTSSKPPSSKPLPDMLRPPINRVMRTLDRSFFQRTIPLAAATVFDPKNLKPIKNQLIQSKDILSAPRLQTIYPVQNPATKEEARLKCILLREGLKADDATTWSPTIQELVNAKTVELKPYNLSVGYDYWTHHEIFDAILPEESLVESPAGFSQVGHVAHLNLRDQYLPFKYIIAEVIKDKNPTVRTVINKVEDVGAQSQYRTFAYEHLAGEKDMNVVAHEQGCEFAFDYSKVYWNTRLSTEHTHMVSRFKEGEAVCDVMAGVGPFALPAGKKKVFVLANDLNPHGYEKILEGIQRNRVEGFVHPHNMDGRKFIRYATQKLQAEQITKTVYLKSKKRDLKRKSPSAEPDSKKYVCPPTFDHFVMNLPATAIEFLDAFIGVYAGQEKLFYPHTSRRLPLVHVYCFSTNSSDNAIEYADICQRISEKLQFTISPNDTVDGTGNTERELEIRDIRLVSPQKRMFCATFRLPAEVIFRTP
ncbi:tRNA(m(1)G37)methyltransferase [Myotisia sp. PD_48]|nr:tRNA(m(1)G37)methyltransferase [Myotisia sp. PD_48]